MHTMLTAIRAALFTALLTGLAYPLALGAASGLLFPAAAGGSLVKDEAGTVIGSDLIGQKFSARHYFQPRPSAAGAGYDANGSCGSNLGPTSKALRDRAGAEVARLRAENPAAPLPIPADLVTASASGLDPHVSPAAARWQAPRIAAARDVSLARVEAVIDALVEGRTLGLLGEPRVNVLRLNLRLDRDLGRPSAAPPAGTGG